MKKEIRKMYLWAVLKILFALGLTAVVVFVMIESGSDIGTAGVVVCSVLWGIVAIVYLYKGIRTVIRGAKQAKEYMQNSGYSEMQLEEEFARSSAFGRVHVGDTHVFVNGSDQFYIIPLVTINDVYVLNHGANRAKGREGYYYLYIKADGITRWVKAYYMSKKRANEAMEYIQLKMPEKTA